MGLRKAQEFFQKKMHKFQDKNSKFLTVAFPFYYFSTLAR
jgi:hypothetical protein